MAARRHLVHDNAQREYIRRRSELPAFELLRRHVFHGAGNSELLRSDARRLAEQGSVQWRGEKITNPKAKPDFTPGEILRLDKTRAVRLI